MSRDNRRTIAKRTLAIFKQGHYYNSQDKRIEVAELMQSCVANTKLYTPDQVEALLSEGVAGESDTRIQVVNETSLQAAKRLAKSEGKVLCLNFASAKNPGGGFLGGSQAQEESLARSSGLYDSLQSQPEFYKFHRKQSNLLYSNHIIYSPAVPIIRNDDGDLLDQPYLLSFITASAPNAGAIKSNTPERLDDIKPTFVTRSAAILALAASQGYQRLILGAWGCGVFQNKPEDVAEVFATHLKGEYKNVFKEVHFAVLDRSKEEAIFKCFKDALTS